MPPRVNHLEGTFNPKLEKQIEKIPVKVGGTGVSQLLNRRVPGGSQRKTDIFMLNDVNIEYFAPKHYSALRKAFRTKQFWLSAN